MTESTYDPYAEEQLVEQPKPKGRIFTPFGAVIALAAVLMVAVVAWGIYQNEQTQPESGPAPDFDLPLLGAEGNFKLTDYRGEVVVINFWGSWCVPCRVEAPMLQQMWEDYQDQGVVFVGIAVKDIERDSLAYIDELGITYPNVMDKGGQTEKDYRTQGVPETFVVGKDGEIVKFFFAQPRESDLRAAIEEALNA
jgi:cytochrome c biogenesis protein CcmG/thiol:disulfide interchange protein DsbE